MMKAAVIYVFNDDFVGDGRELRDLKDDIKVAARTAHMVIYHGRLLKNRLGAVPAHGR